MIFQLFKKRTAKASLSDFSVLGTDMHSHLVPGVDDGADTLETSLLLLRGLSELGYKKIITTPHIRPDYFPNTPEIILAGFEKLKKAVVWEGIAMQLECAAEYFVDYEFRAYMEREKLLIFNGNHLLIEVSTFSAPPNLFDTIFQMRIKGYQPIIAHPERYIYYQLSDFEKLKDFGCLLQVNTMSLMGHYGKPVKELAQKLLKANLVDLLGTDMHNPRHLEVLKKATKDAGIMNIVAGRDFKNATF